MKSNNYALTLTDQLLIKEETLKNNTDHNRFQQGCDTFKQQDKLPEVIVVTLNGNISQYVKKIGNNSRESKHQLLVDRPVT